MFLKKRFPLPAVVLNAQLITSSSQAVSWTDSSSSSSSSWVNLQWVHRRAEAGTLRGSCQESVIIWTDYMHEWVSKLTETGPTAQIPNTSACRSEEGFSSERELRLPTCSLSGRPRFLRVARFRWTCSRRGRLTAPLPAVCPGMPLLYLLVDIHFFVQPPIELLCTRVNS